MEIPKAQVFKLNSFTDLIRLVVLNSQARGGYIYYGFKNGKNIYAISHLVPGWYNLRGLPITLIAETDEEPKSDFIAYTYGANNSEENWEFVNQVDNKPNKIYIPIIRVDEFPEFLL